MVSDTSLFTSNLLSWTHGRERKFFKCELHSLLNNCAQGWIMCSVDTLPHEIDCELINALFDEPQPLQWVCVKYLHDGLVEQYKVEVEITMVHIKAYNKWTGAAVQRLSYHEHVSQDLPHQSPGQGGCVQLSPYHFIHHVETQELLSNTRTLWANSFIQIPFQGSQV